MQYVNNDKLPMLNRGYVVAQLVEVLRYKPESCGLDCWNNLWNAFTLSTGCLEKFWSLFNAFKATKILWI